MKRLLVAIIGIPLLLGGIALILIGVIDDEDEEAPTATSTPTASAKQTVSAAPTTIPPRAGVCGDNPDPASSDTNEVDTPAPGDLVSGPFTVSGRIAAFEAAFRIQILDADGDVISAVLGMSEEGQTLAPFEEEVPYLVNEETPACLWVFVDSAADGTPTNIVQVPITMSAPGAVCLPNPDPGTPDVVRVDTPAAGDAVTSPVNVSGRISAFEAVLQITIFDSSGEIIADQTGHADEGSALSPFFEDVPFTATGATPACIWIYESSARDGSPIHIVQIPVVLQP